MSEAVTEVPVTAASRRSRRRRKRSSAPAGKKVWIVLGSLGLLMAVLFFGVRIWIRNYLQSDRFRVWISGELSRRIGADVQMDRIQWEDTTATVGKFTARGAPGGAFSMAEARDVRAMVNAGRIWDRVWQVDEVKVSHFFADLSRNGAPASSGPVEATPSVSSQAASGFFASFLPNRTQVKGVSVDRAAFVWKGAEQTAEARDINLQIKPSDGHQFYIANARGGTVDLSVLPDCRVSLRSMQATLQDGEVTVEEFRAGSAGADVSVEGTVSLGDAPALDLTGTVSGLDIARVEPEDWIKRLQGTMSGEVHVSGDPRELSRLTWRGTAQMRDGYLEGLPILHVIAKKTRNEGFMRLILKEARAAFVRAGDGGWLVEKLTLDAPGLLRLKGTVSCAPDRTLRGDLLLGIVPGTLRYLAGAEQQVFLPLDKLLVTRTERNLITNEDAGLLWTRLRLGGTLDHPEEDLADRLAQAWFNATVDQVMNMSMEDAAKAAETASRLAAAAAGQVLEKAPEILESGLKTGTELLEKGIENGGGLLEKGVEGGLKTIEGLLPK